MKFICKYCSTAANGNPSKPLQVQIGFCQKNGVTQMHVTSKAKKETHIISAGNIKKIHDKFKHKGKATIEFKNPTFMVMISDATPKELEKALRIIGLACSGAKPDNIAAEISAILPTMKKKDLKLKEHITSTNDYPVKEGFSASLIELRINTFRMRSVDIRWFALKHLTVLDLSHNRLGLMEEFEWKKFNRISKLTNLTTLILSNNGLMVLPWEFVHSIPKTVDSLQLDDNKLSYLPDELCDLAGLVQFSAKNNPLEDLPEDLLFRCRYLRAFDVSGTLVKYHSVAITNLRLKYFASSAIGNPSLQYDLRKREVPTLFSVASSMIYDSRPTFFFLPYNVRFRMRRELFRCNKCYELYPLAFKKSAHLIPLGASVISEETTAPQGTLMQLNLLDQMCARCYKELATRMEIL